MRILESAGLWLRALVFRGRVETEMDKEIRLHLEMETEHNLRHGMPPEEAQRWIEQFVSDLRFAFRGFRRQPAFTGGVVTLIALGVGANAAIFSVIYNLLISPLPFTDGNRMVQLSVTSGGGRILTGATAETADRWRARARAVESITVVEHQRLELGDTAHGPIERINGVALGPGAMAFVGMQPVYGRDIAAADTLQNAVPVVLLSYGFWQRVFGGQLDAIGRTIVLGNVSHTVIGVMPESFSVPFLDHSHVYPALRVGKPDHSVDVIAKLRRGVMVEDANRELAAIFTNVDARASEDVPRVERAVDQVPAEVKRTVLLMFGAVGIVLLIACANVANLLATRTWTRQREFAIRGAMGAGRARLVRQVFVESLSLAVIGGVAGVAVSVLTLRLLRAQSGIGRYTVGAHLEPAVLLWLLGDDAADRRRISTARPLRRAGAAHR